jgi:hypothetical protein
MKTAATLTGTCSWHSAELDETQIGVVTRAVIGDDRIALDVERHGERYRFVLSPKEGQWIGTPDARTSAGVAITHIRKLHGGAWELSGPWKEEGQDWTFRATVEPSDASPVDDDVSVEELQKAVEHMHGVPAKFDEAVEVDERFNGEVVWQGAVKVFALEKHPSGATRAYAWSYLVEGTRRKFKAVLGVPPVDGPVMAVRASILAEQQKKRN